MAWNRLKTLKGRAVFSAVGGGMIAGGIFLATGSPRLTLLNASIRVDYPWSRGAALLFASAGVGLLGWSAPWRWLRVALGGLGLAFALASLHLWLYRLEADEKSLTAHGLLPTTTLPWREVSHVDSGRDALVVWGRGDDQIRIDTASFRTDQREALERGIARRVRDAAGAR